MKDLHNAGLDSDHIIMQCRNEFPESRVRAKDVFNALFRERGDDLQSLHDIIMKEVL